MRLDDDELPPLECSRIRLSGQLKANEINKREIGECVMHVTGLWHNGSATKCYYRKREAGAAATARAVEGQRIELPVASVCRTASAGGGGGGE